MLFDCGSDNSRLKIFGVGVYSKPNLEGKRPVYNAALDGALRKSEAIIFNSIAYHL